MEVWELKLYFYPSAGQEKKKSGRLQPTYLRNFKIHLRSRQRAQQQRISRMLIYIGAAACAPFSTCDTTSRRGILSPSTKCTFWTLDIFARCFPAPAGPFSRSRLRGTHGARLYTTVQVWVPARLRGACSKHSISPNLASTRGIAFRPAIANHANATP